MLANTDPAARGGAPAGAVVTALYCYPIKSCAGTALDEAALDERGIRHDRELLVIDAATGRFLTQRELPRMALIRPRIADGELLATAPGLPDLAAPIGRKGATREVAIWRDRCPAVDQGADAARWFSDFLRHDCRLVRLAEGYVRRVDPAYATSERDQVGFADGYPALLLSEESLADLNGRLAAPLPMDRFRPNIVVAGGGGPYAEDRLARVRIGAVDFHVVKACARCAITTTDQATAERGKEPLATLATYRRVERGVLFGQNLIHAGPGLIRRGDRVEVLARR